MHRTNLKSTKFILGHILFILIFFIMLFTNSDSKPTEEPSGTVLGFSFEKICLDHLYSLN